MRSWTGNRKEVPVYGEVEGEYPPFSGPKPWLWCLKVQDLEQDMKFLSFTSSRFIHALFHLFYKRLLSPYSVPRALPGPVQMTSLIHGPCIPDRQRDKGVKYTLPATERERQRFLPDKQTHPPRLCLSPCGSSARIPAHGPGHQPSPPPFKIGTEGQIWEEGGFTLRQVIWLSAS